MVKFPENSRPKIAVFGGRVSSDELLEEAYQVGVEIAKRGGIVYCGGMGGVMESVAKGAAEHDGVTVGILPTQETADANQYITIPVATGIGTARNYILARSADAAVAINGKYGTLSEIAYSLDFQKPVVGIGTWEIDGVIPVSGAMEAINKLWEICQWE